MKTAQRERLSQIRLQQWADPNGPYRRPGRTTRSGPKPIGQRTLKGYVYLYRPDHPHVIGAGYVKRSRLLVEASLGRFLEPSEHVHHVNGVKMDDRIENLVVLSRAEHNHVHKAKADGASLIGRWDTRGGHCSRCGRNDRPHRARGLCGACYEWFRRREI